MSDQTVLFKEAQTFSPTFYLILVFSLIMSVTLGSIIPSPGPMTITIVVVLILTSLLSVNLMYMRTAVLPGEMVVTFGLLFPLYHKRIPLDNVHDIEPVKYLPLADYGGWGIRGWGQRRALNARGDLGVLLTLDNDIKLLIGSQVPEELASAAAQARHYAR